MSGFNAYAMNENDLFVKTRTVYLMGEVNAASAYDVMARLKFLDYINSEEEITVEINSPGGEVSSGLAIIDTMDCIGAPVRTVVCGMAASMAAVIAACGTHGKRLALPHSTIMIHQPLGGFGASQASDIAIYANNIIKTRNLLNKILAERCNKSIEEVERDTDRDNYMDVDEAIAYGLIDAAVEPKRK